MRLPRILLDLCEKVSTDSDDNYSHKRLISKILQDFHHARGWHILLKARFPFNFPHPTDSQRDWQAKHYQQAVEAFGQHSQPPPQLNVRCGIHMEQVNFVSIQFVVGRREINHLVWLGRYYFSIVLDFWRINLISFHSIEYR